MAQQCARKSPFSDWIWSPFKLLICTNMIRLPGEGLVCNVMVHLIEEQIRLYAKYLKIPTFGDYSEALRHMRPDDSFETILLELMKRESLQRQENQNRRRLKAAAFPYQKSLDELDVGRYDEKLTDTFLAELASCQFVSDRKNVVRIANPGRGKTHMAIGLGLKACAQGLQVIFKNAATLSTELTEAKDNYSLG